MRNHDHYCPHCRRFKPCPTNGRGGPCVSVGRDMTCDECAAEAIPLGLDDPRLCRWCGDPLEVADDAICGACAYAEAFGDGQTGMFGEVAS